MAPVRQARFEMPIVRAEIEKSGAIYRYALLSRDTLKAPDWLRARMNLQVGSEVVHLVCLHSANGEAFQLEDRWINGAALPQGFDPASAKLTVNKWMLGEPPMP